MDSFVRAFAGTLGCWRMTAFMLVMFVKVILQVVQAVNDCGLLSGKHILCLPPYALAAILILDGWLVWLGCLILVQGVAKRYYAEALLEVGDSEVESSLGEVPDLLVEPEAIINDRPYVQSVDPKCQLDVYSNGRFVGHAVRVGEGTTDILVVPAHVVAYLPVQWRKNGQTATADLHFRHVQDDVLVCDYPASFAHLGVSKGRIATLTARNQVTLTSRGKASVGSLRLIRSRAGYFSFDANTEAGFSGCAAMSGNACCAVHLGHVAQKGHQLSFSVDLAMVMYQDEDFLPGEGVTCVAESSPDHEDLDAFNVDADGGRYGIRGGRYRYTGLDELREKARDYQDQVEDSYERTLQSELDRVEANMKKRGFAFDSVVVRRITNKVRKSHGKDELSAMYDNPDASGYLVESSKPVAKSSTPVDVTPEAAVVVKPVAPVVKATPEAIVVEAPVDSGIVLSSRTRKSPDVMVDTTTRFTEAGHHTDDRYGDACRFHQHRLRCLDCPNDRPSYLKRLGAALSPFYSPEAVVTTPDVPPEAEQVFRPGPRLDEQRVEEMISRAVALAMRYDSSDTESEYPSTHVNESLARPLQSSQKKRRRRRKNTSSPSGTQSQSGKALSSTGTAT